MMEDWTPDVLCLHLEASGDAEASEQTISIRGSISVLYAESGCRVQIDHTRSTGKYAVIIC